MFEDEVQNATGMKRRGVGVGGGQESGSGLGRAGDSGSVTTSGQPRRGTPFTTLAQQTLTSRPPLLLTLLWPASILASALALPHPLPRCPYLAHPRTAPGTRGDQQTFTQKDTLTPGTNIHSYPPPLHVPSAQQGGGGPRRGSDIYGRRPAPLTSP